MLKVINIFGISNIFTLVSAQHLGNKGEKAGGGNYRLFGSFLAEAKDFKNAVRVAQSAVARLYNSTCSAQKKKRIPQCFRSMPLLLCNC